MSGYHISPATYACWLSLAIAVVSFTSAAEARSRIETGSDLYGACRVLSEYTLNPQGSTPREALYCRKYIAGYFATIKYLHDEEDVRRVMGSKAQDPYACVDIRSSQSFAQLAKQIVRTGEWNPKLLDEPALVLAQKTFGDNPPC